MKERKQIIENVLQKLIRKMKELSYKEHWVRLTREYVNELQQRGVYGVDKFVLRLKRCTKGQEPREYWDILMEGRFAIILARNGFSKIHVEYSDKGMDIKANLNRNVIYFDVTRKRSIDDEWAEQKEEVELPSSEPESIIGKIQDKIGQLIPGKTNILVLWSDTIAWGEPEVRVAFDLILQEINQNLGVYKDLSGILFTSGGGVNLATLKQFYLFKNDKASKPLGIRLARKLESLHEQNPEQLQEEINELAAALARKTNAISCQ